jgi:hypothetical protein
MFILYLLSLPLVVSAFGGSAVNFRGKGEVLKSQAQEALRAEMGSSARDLTRLEADLRHLFVSLPKNTHGNLGHDAVRIAIFRYFVQRNGWYLKGFGTEAYAKVHVADGQEVTDTDRVPQLLQDAFDIALGERGADLHSLAAFAAAIEDLVRFEAKAHLTDAYVANNVSLASTSSKEVKDVLYTYFTSVLVDHNWTAANRMDLKAQMTLFRIQFSQAMRDYHWVDSLISKQWSSGVDFNSSLESAVKVLEDYKTLNDEECAALRSELHKLESRKPGRIRLSAFYKSKNSLYDFDESVETLKALGALDDSDPSQPSVILANYALAPNNCFRASKLFLICCSNICEGLLQDIERQVQDSTAEVSVITRIVSSLASENVPAPRVLPEPLLARLDEIATMHGGVVPIHGRLFKQWLHHAYPLDCPYPHEAGTINPELWTGSDKDKATAEERKKHIEEDTCAVNFEGKIDCGETAELPWNMNEELIGGGTLLGSGSGKGELWAFPLAFLALGLLAIMKLRAPKTIGLNRLILLLFLALCGRFVMPELFGILVVVAVLMSLVTSHSCRAKAGFELPMQAKSV